MGVQVLRTAITIAPKLLLLVIPTFGCLAHVKYFFAEHPNNLKSGLWVPSQQVQQASSRNEIQSAVARDLRRKTVRLSRIGIRRNKTAWAWD